MKLSQINKLCRLYCSFRLLVQIQYPLPDFVFNRIYNNILDRDWLSARLFVTYSAHDHVGVQLQVSDLNFL